MFEVGLKTLMGLIGFWEKDRCHEEHFYNVLKFSRGMERHVQIEERRFSPYTNFTYDTYLLHPLAVSVQDR